jgi:hypothetical protein
MIDIRRVFVTGWAMFRQRFWVLLGMWAVFFAIQIGGSILLGIGALLMGAAGLAGFGSLLEDPAAAAGVGIGMIVVFVLLYSAYIVLVLAQQAALVTLASPLEEPSFGAAISRGFRSALPFFGVVVLLVIGWFALSFLAGALATMGGGSPVGELVRLVLLVPLLVYLGCRLSVLVPVVAVERVFNPIAALRRCWAVTQGKLRSILLALLAFLAVTLVLLGVPFGILLSLVLNDPVGAESTAAALLPLVFFPVLIVYSIFAATYVAALHYEVTGGGAEALEDVFA